MAGGSLFTSGGLGTDISIFLVACLIVTLLFTATQLVRIIHYSSTAGSVHKWAWWCFPWTVQKQIHALIFLSSAARVAFLFVVAQVWDETSGTLINTDDNQGLRMAFYILDELPLMLFFSTALVLASFWAKVHYDAEDEARWYDSMIHPTLHWLHALTYGGIIILWSLYGTMWKEFDYYMKEAVAYYLSVVYVLGGGVLVWYARLTVQGVSQVPIEVQVRKRKLREIWWTSLVVAAAMVVRVGVVLDVAGVALPLTGWADWVMVLVYLWLIENVPSLVILYYFHRMPSAMAMEWMVGGSPSYEDKMAFTRLLGATTTKSPDKVSAEMIENSIRRLSILQARRQGGNTSSLEGHKGEEAA